MTLAAGSQARPRGDAGPIALVFPVLLVITASINGC